MIWALKSLKNLHFDWSLSCKVNNVWPKKYRGVIFHDTEESYNIWRKTDLWLGKWHEEFEKCSVEHLELSKLGLWKCMSLKFTGKLCVITMKNDGKYWRGIDLSVQNWYEEFNEFWPKHSKISKICTLMGCFCPKNMIIKLRKYKGVMFDSTEYWCKIWRKIDLCFQKWHEKFGRFSPEDSKVSKLGL